jgi:15-cis-phytoene synthase
MPLPPPDAMTAGTRAVGSGLFGARPPTASRDPSSDLAACRAALRDGSRSFLAASLLLPRRVHEPASALYAFCRLADDAVDDMGDAQDAPPGAPASDVDALRRRRRTAVVALHRRLDAVYAGRPDMHTADRALAVVVARHAIPRPLFDALLEGFGWDAEGRRYESIDELLDYCARVAGTVGAMMALVMGVRSRAAIARACDLGVAMQLSNIARDVGEDARNGRLYLPLAWLRDAGIDATAFVASPRPGPALAGVVQRLLGEADALYARAGAGVALLPIDCRPGINAARFLYAAIGHEVARRGLDPVSSRARVGRPRKAVLMLRALGAIAPSAAAAGQPPLCANHFLVEAAAQDAPPTTPQSNLQFNPQFAPQFTPPSGPAPRRSIADRLVWTLELFARLERLERRGST